MINPSVKLFIILSIFLSLFLTLPAVAATGDPIGWLDSVSSDCKLNGWSFVKDNPPVTVNVEVYLDGPKGTGKLVATTATNIFRPDVNSYFGIDGNHGYAAAIPQIYHDGKSHSIYVYANNTVTVNISVVLSGVPKSCTPKPSPSPTPTPTNSISPSPSSSVSPSPSASVTPTPGTSVSPTPSPTASGSPTPSPSSTVSPTPTVTIPLPPPQPPSPTPTPTNGDITPPVVTITSPADNTSFSYRILLTAVAQDTSGISGVTFVREGDIALGLTDITSPYSMYLYASRLTVGQHTLTAIATDRVGNVGRSAPITVTVVPPPDTVAPYISTISSFDITPFTASIKWTTNEPADGQIEFCPTYSHCANFTPLVSDLTTAHIINLSNLIPNTKYYYWIRSKDATGNLRISPTQSFTTALPPDFFPPEVTITAPENGATVAGRILIAANATDDVGIAGVKFYIDGVLVRTEDVYAPFNAYFYTDTIANGSHALTAVARDNVGNTTTSAPVTVNVNNLDTIAPYISAISVSNVTQFAATIKWTTSEAATGQVEFCTTSSRCANYTPLISELSTAHSINLSGLNPGTLYYYRVISKDASGNTATSLVRSFMTLN
jgi:hypothetical protein